jgi:hypothetical protein
MPEKKPGKAVSEADRGEALAWSFGQRSAESRLALDLLFKGPDIGG